MDLFFEYLEWPAMAISLVAAWLLGSTHANKRVWAFWLLTLGNVMWITWGWHDSAYALIGLNLGLMALNIRAIRKNENA
jgi:hypothetical protein